MKGLVRLHDGDIDIRSRLGEGTRMTVRLPVDSGGKRPAAEPVRLMIERARATAAPAKREVKKSV